MSIDETCEHIVRQVCFSNLDFHMNQTPYSIYFSIRKKFIKGFSPQDNRTDFAHQKSETEPFRTNGSVTNENILEKEIKRLKLELKKKATVEDDLNKLKLFQKEIETENQMLRKELLDQKNKYEHKCTEVKTLKGEIQTLKKDSKKELSEKAKKNVKKVKETKNVKISEKKNKIEDNPFVSDSETFDFNYNIPTSNLFDPLTSLSSPEATFSPTDTVASSLKALNTISTQRQSISSHSIVASPTSKSSFSSSDVSSPVTTSEPVSLSTNNSITFNKKQKQEEILAALKMFNDQLVEVTGKLT